MTTLNLVHRFCYDNNCSANITFYWPSPKGFLYYFDDVETEWERIEYIKTLYFNPRLVSTSHTFNHPIRKRLKSNHLLLDNEPYPWGTKDSNWRFEDSLRLPVRNNKVVIWSYLHNASRPKDWKTAIGNWHEIPNTLDALGYDVVELTHRTPIREAVWHINTCEFIVSYDGMWHYISKNFAKPHFVTSNGWFTKIHTPQAIMLNREDMVLPSLYQVENTNVFKRAEKYRNFLGNIK